MSLVKETKITIEGKSTVNGKDVMGFRAIIDIEDPENMTLHPWQIDKEACKTNRSIVRADQAEFEDYAYLIQEDVISKMTL